MTSENTHTAVQYTQPQLASQTGGIRSFERLFQSNSAQGIAVDLAWLGQTFHGPHTSDPQKQTDAAVLALDAVFSQYGR